MRFLVIHLLVLSQLASVSFAQTLAISKSVTSARKQISVTTLYDPEYVVLTYPNGDVPQDRGVCTDVIIRALRDAYKMDLQKLVHEDMQKKILPIPKRGGCHAPTKTLITAAFLIFRLTLEGMLSH